MKILQRIIGFVAGIATILFLFITSFEIAAYGDYSWYEKEYLKYGVLDELEMEISDVLDVTEEMMAYLRGNREDLVVHTIVDGEEREFFNDREKAHMVDVQELFIGGLWIRRIAVVLLILSIIFLIKTKADLKRMLPNSFLAATGSVLLLTIVAGAVFMSDFSKYFTIFHEIFFDNDLWLLDPRTDLLIRMLPEEFFLDMVARIGVIFFVAIFLLLIISIVMLVKSKNKKN